ncbi:hypothetical protein C4552_03940 [Candidatus Parcubacteria bacterium]|nr:MAG: hypothetical protein C4552_03940 [Candidatus Parcubacteria bacterium]
MAGTATKLIGAVLSVAIIGSAIAWLSRAEDAAPVSPAAGMHGGPPPGMPGHMRRYADGTYAATGNYISPAGREEIEIMLTVADDIVVDAHFTGKATHATSRTMQGRFGAGFREHVVGKPIDQIVLDVVNGSSLTPKGFMEALAKIKAEASS